MSDLIPRKRGRISHTQRVDRGYRLILWTGATATAFVVTVLLAVIGVIGAGLPAALALATGAFGYGAYRTIAR